MPASPPSSAVRPIAILLAGIAIAAFGFWLRLAHYTVAAHPDHSIVVGVVGYMRQSGDWDTNWAKAELDATLRYNQYNFSSYHYAVYFFYRLVKLVPSLEAWRSADSGIVVYRLFSVLMASVVVVQAMMIARRLGGATALLGAGTLVAIAPLLVQDSKYMRAESFTTMLTLAAVALSWPQEKRFAIRTLGASLCIGLLIACKVSMLALAWLPFVPLAARWKDLRRPWLFGSGVVLAIAAGFALGAPGAVRDPAIFIHGVQKLATQYAGAHPPYSHYPVRPIADILGGYFTATLGWPFIVAALTGAARLAWQRRWPALALLAAPVALFGIYFATRTVFFERNLSHVVPLFAIMAAWGVAELLAIVQRRYPKLPAIARGALAIGLLIVIAVRPAAITRRLVGEELSGRATAAQNAFEAALRARHPQAEWRTTAFMTNAPIEPLTRHFSQDATPVLLRVTDYHDDWTKAHLPLLAQRFKAELLAEWPSTFPNVPVCTLHTYHRARHVYFLISGRRE